MTGTIYRTGRHEIDHLTFGGEIFSSDFNTDYRGKNNTNGSTIASRIVNDWIFDKRCQKNIEERIRNNEWRKKNNA